ncbi:hypothetical protein ACW18Q_00805 [Limosilactobacillus reuteri]
MLKAQDAQFQKRTEARRQLGHGEAGVSFLLKFVNTFIMFPDYLEEFVAICSKKMAGHVFFAKDGNEASAFIKQLALKKRSFMLLNRSMVTMKLDWIKIHLTIPGLSLMETDLLNLF